RQRGGIRWPRDIHSFALFVSTNTATTTIGIHARRALGCGLAGYGQIRLGYFPLCQMSGGRCQSMDTEVTSKRPSTLKKCLYVGLGFGSGAVLMSAVIVGSFVWYSNHPKPWNTDAIKASFSQETYGLINNDFNITEMTLEY